MAVRPRSFMGGMMSNEKKRPGWILWTTMAMVGLRLRYVISFGPACWWFSTALPGWDEPMEAPTIYAPIGWVYWNTDDDAWICRAIRRYATLRHRWITVPHNLRGDRVPLIRIDGFSPAP